jgi:hypothetical protein
MVRNVNSISADVRESSFLILIWKFGLFDVVNVTLFYLFLKFAQVNLYLSTMYAYYLYTYIRYFTSNKMEKATHGQNSFYLRLENRRNRGKIDPLNTYT